MVVRMFERVSIDDLDFLANNPNENEEYDSNNP